MHVQVLCSQRSVGLSEGRLISDVKKKNFKKQQPRTVFWQTFVFPMPMFAWKPTSVLHGIALRCYLHQACQLVNAAYLLRSGASLLSTDGRLTEEISFRSSVWFWVFPKIRGTPKSFILIGFSIINHPF